MPFQALGREPLSCREFREAHSDFLDGLLPSNEAWRFEAHLRECRECNRFDRVLRRGLLLARNVTDIQPSSNFQEKLQARLMGLETEAPRPVVASTGTALVVAAVLALIAVTPLLHFETDKINPAAPRAADAVPLDPLFAPPTPFGAVPSSNIVSVDVLPSNFSPVVVQPPSFDGAPVVPRLVTPVLETVAR